MHSKDVVQQIDDQTSIALRLQMATGYALPPIVPWQTVVTVPQAGQNGQEPDALIQGAVGKGLRALGSTLYQVPVKLRLSDEPEEKGFTLPLDPIVSVNEKNIITRRYVAKSEKRGSIKERWSEDDYEVNIAGVLMADENHTIDDYVTDLLRYCEAKEAVIVTCEMLNSVYRITRLCVESCDFPFTKGTENQSFSIKAYSDDLYTLLEEEEAANV